MMRHTTGARIRQPSHTSKQRSTPDTVSAVHEVMARIRMVPDNVREFTESTMDSRRVHRIRPALLEQLLDLGLPHRGTGDDGHFDRWDLANVGVSLGLPCARHLAMRWWSKALADLQPGPPIGYTLELGADCPDPTHDGPCDFVLSPLFGRAAAVRRVRPGTWSLDVELPRGLRLFTDPFTPLIEHAESIRFHLLPVALSQNVGFLAETKLADCRAATIHLTRLGRKMGLPVRSAVGYFVAPPYATAHAWIEFEVDGEWWPADPFLLTALKKWGIIDPAQWPRHRSPQGLLWRLDGRYFEGLWHGDTPVYPTITMTDRRLGKGPDPVQLEQTGS
jgi:hypothetical protein